MFRPEARPCSAAVRLIKKILKDILRRQGVTRAVCWLGAQYMRLVHSTGRWTVVRGDIAEAYWRTGRPFILCFWHGRVLMLPFCWDRAVAIHTLTSRHPDGRLIAETTAHLGIRTVTGSSGGGGAGGFRALLKVLKKGSCVGLAPDGPRGPRMRASAGVIALARIAQVPIVPIAYGVDRRRVLKSWDRFIVALPFGRGVILWGEPILVRPDADGEAVEAARRILEESLNAITAEADRRCGTTPVEPAPLAAGTR